MSMKMPKGKYMATVKVGEKGQIVIPKGARELFGIEPGDTLLLMADVKQGIAIVQNDAYMKFVDAVFSVQQEPPVAPDGELETENERASVRGLCKRYGSFALRDVSFDVAPGSITGFIGRNGAGKTTTLKSLLDFVHPDARRGAVFWQAAVRG